MNNGYSKISRGSTTTHNHKSRSIDFSDFFSSLPAPQTPSKPQQQQQEQEPDHNLQVKKSKIPEAVTERERELDEGGERFGVILGRSDSVSSSSESASASASGFQATMKRAFSMRRSSSVSERYCRIHDQYMAIASPITANIADHEIDDDDGNIGSIWRRRRRSMKKKKLRGGSKIKIFKACKRLLGL